MDFGNFDQWAKRFSLGGPVFKPDPATTSSGMPMPPGTYTNRQSVQGLVPNRLPPYGEQSIEASAPSPYAPQFREYNTAYQTQLMFPSHNAQNLNQEIGRYNSRYCPASINSTDDPYTNDSPSSDQSLVNQGLNRPPDSFQHNDVLLSVPKEPVSNGKENEPFKNEENSIPHQRPTTSRPEENQAAEEVPLLSEPLSVLARNVKNYRIQDMSAFVKRGVRQRRREDIKRGLVKGVCSEFGLYFKAYRPLAQELIELGFIRNDKSLRLPRYLTKICSFSWHIEPYRVRNQYHEWALINRKMHNAAFPDYKQPTKRSKKTAKTASESTSRTSRRGKKSL